MGDQDRAEQQHQRPGGAPEDALHMLRRPLHQKAVYDDRGQGSIDQYISQRFTALQADFSAFVQQEANPRKQEHLQHLFHENQYHVTLLS